MIKNVEALWDINVISIENDEGEELNIGAEDIDILIQELQALKKEKEKYDIWVE